MKRFEHKQTGILSSSDLKTPYGKFLYWTFFTILAIVAVVAVVPAIWTILTSFKDTQEIYAAFSFFPQDMSWGKMAERVTES